MRERFAAAAAAERDRGRSDVPLHRRAARRRLDVRRLASHTRPLPPASRRCGDDLRIPGSARRARTRPSAAPRLPPRAAAPVAVRAPLHQPAAAGERRRRDAPLAPSRTGAARARVAHGSDRRSRAAADRRRGAAQGRDGHPRDRPLRLDAGDRRHTFADGSGTSRCRHVHQGPSKGLQGRARLVLRPGRRRPSSDLRPRRRPSGRSVDASGRQRHRHRGRDHSLRRSRSLEPR